MSLHLDIVITRNILCIIISVVITQTRIFLGNVFHGYNIGFFIDFIVKTLFLDNINLGVTFNFINFGIIIVRIVILSYF